MKLASTFSELWTSVWGQSRPKWPVRPMSAFPPIAPIERTSLEVADERLIPCRNLGRSRLPCRRIAGLRPKYDHPIILPKKIRDLFTELIKSQQITPLRFIQDEFECRLSEFLVEDVISGLDHSLPTPPPYQLALLWQIFWINRRNWIPESGFQ
jgi:hypothetical protein